MNISRKLLLNVLLVVSTIAGGVIPSAHAMNLSNRIQHQEAPTVQIPAYVFFTILGDVESLKECIESYQESGGELDFTQTITLTPEIQGSVLEFAQNLGHQDVLDYLKNQESESDTSDQDDDEIIMPSVGVPCNVLFALMGKVDLLNTCYNQYKFKLDLVHYIGEAKGTLLYFACLNGHAQIVEWLVNHGANLNDFPAFRTACIFGQTEIVKIFLAQKEQFNINLTDRSGASALFLSVYHNQKDVVTLLLDAGADLFLSLKKGKFNCFHVACEDRGRLEIACAIFAYAKEHQDNKMLMKLIHTPSSEHTSIDYACMGNSHEILESMLQAHPEGCVHADRWRDALAYAVEYGSTDCVISLMQQEHLKYYLENTQRLHFLEIILLACECANLEILKILMDAYDGQYAQSSSMRYAIFAALEADGQTPLMIAARCGKIEVIEFLIKRAHQHQVELPLAYSTYVKNMLEKKPDGTSPLIYACRNGNIPCVMMLLKESAACHIKYRTSLFGSIAEISKHYTLAQYLENETADPEKNIIRDLDFCVICQDNFKQDDACLALSCGHTFHHTCLSEWKKEECPCCRQDTNKEVWDEKACRKFCIFKKQ